MNITYHLILPPDGPDDKLPPNMNSAQMTAALPKYLKDLPMIDNFPPSKIRSLNGNTITMNNPVNVATVGGVKKFLMTRLIPDGILLVTLSRRDDTLFLQLMRNSLH